MELRHTNTLLLLSLLLLSRNLEALLQSETLLTPLLLLPILLLLTLIQRTKQRVCWRSSSFRQDWQVSRETPQLILLHRERLIRIFEVWKDQHCLFLYPAADLVVPAQQQNHTEAAGEGGASSVSVSAPRVSIPASAHHYCFSLDLRSLGSLRLSHPIAATLRWHTSAPSGLSQN